MTKVIGSAFSVNQMHAFPGGCVFALDARLVKKIERLVAILREHQIAAAETACSACVWVENSAESIRAGGQAVPAGMETEQGFVRVTPEDFQFIAHMAGPEPKMTFCSERMPFADYPGLAHLTLGA